jgi:hypothetical protein
VQILVPSFPQILRIFSFLTKKNLKHFLKFYCKVSNTGRRTHKQYWKLNCTGGDPKSQVLQAPMLASLMIMS